MTKRDILEYFADLNYVYNNPNKLDALSYMIDKLLEEQPKWISVKDRLPEEKVWVLCLCRAGIHEVLRWQNGQWLHDLSPFAYMKSFVTHWMPLPEPPKEGVNDESD